MHRGICNYLCKTPSLTLFHRLLQSSQMSGKRRRSTRAGVGTPERKKTGKVSNPNYHEESHLFQIKHRPHRLALPIHPSDQLAVAARLARSNASIPRVGMIAESVLTPDLAKGHAFHQGKLQELQEHPSDPRIALGILGLKAMRIP
jgi:hypothetical protein